MAHSQHTYEAVLLDSMASTAHMIPKHTKGAGSKGEGWKTIVP